jgi:hypothetical protein
MPIAFFLSSVAGSATEPIALILAPPAIFGIAIHATLLITYANGQRRSAPWNPDPALCSQGSGPAPLRAHLSAQLALKAKVVNK